MVDDRWLPNELGVTCVVFDENTGPGHGSERLRWGTWLGTPYIHGKWCI